MSKRILDVTSLSKRFQTTNRSATDMTYRRRVRYRGRYTNRINCPKRYDEEGIKIRSFDDCKKCQHMVAMGWTGVNCDYKRRRT